MAVPPDDRVRLVVLDAMLGLLDVTGAMVAVRLTWPEKPRLVSVTATVAELPRPIDKLLGLADALKQEGMGLVDHSMLS